MNLSLLHSALAQRVLAGPVLLFLLFLAPSCLLLRVCRSGILPRWKYGLPLLPLGQGLLLAIDLFTVLQSSPASLLPTLLFLLQVALHLLADLLLARLLRQMERNSSLRRQQKELEGQLARQTAYYQGLLETEGAMRRLRHDMNNHLQTIGQLLACGEVRQAEDHLARLSALLAQHGSRLEERNGAHVEGTDL